MHDTACVCYDWHCVVDVDAIRFHRCRAANPAGQYFTMDTRFERDCSAGQVIRVQSAQLGYSASYNPHSNPPHCPWPNCTKSTNVPASRCNGRTSCRISQTILNSPYETALCALQRDGNFIRVEFTCVTGMISPAFPHFVAHYYCMTVMVCGSQWKSISWSTAVVLKSYIWVLATTR